MKVNIDETVQVSDEQRVQIACVIDNKISKRIATREELKRFIWGEGDAWSVALADQFLELVQPEQPEQLEQPDLDMTDLDDIL